LATDAIEAPDREAPRHGSKAAVSAEFVVRPRGESFYVDGGPGASLAANQRMVARAAYSTACPDPYPGKRDPSNPLMLPVGPAAGNPLQGANFFVDGPAHGDAAGQIAKLLG
jgi:hypothetical protein